MLQIQVLWTGWAEDDEWWIIFVVWLTNERCLALVPAGTIVRDPHHRKSLTHHKQGLNLHRIKFCSGLLEWSCALVITTTPQSHSYWTLWLNNLGKSITCNMFSDPTLLWSLELDIHNLFSAQCHPSFKYSSKFNYLHLDQLLVSKIATSGTWNSPNLLSLITKWVR